MSNLAQQYISQSYQSVMNVGTGSGASITSTLQPLTDGYGTVSPISVSTTDVAIQGTLSITGSIIPYSTSSVSGAYDLGSPTKPWRHLYVSSGSIYLDGSRVMGLTNDTSNLHFIAPTGSQIQMGTNVFFQNPEVSLNPGMILEATGPETGSSIYFNGGKGQIVSEGDLSFLLVTGDTNNNPSASINFSVANIESGSLSFNGKDNAQINIDRLGDIGLTTIHGAISLNAQSGSVSLIQQQYNGGFEIQPGFMQMRQNDLDGGITIASQSIVVSANNVGDFDVNIKSGSINIQSQSDLNLSSSLGTINHWGSSSFIGQLDVIGGPLKVSGSNSIGTIEVINGGINSQGDIHTSASLLAEANGNFGGATGGQYPTVNVLVDSASFTTDVYGGFQVYDPNTYQTYITAVASSYYTGEIVGAMAGGGAFDGSDLTLYFPMDGTLALRKPTHMLNGANITGSVYISGSQSITGSVGITGNEVISGSLTVSGSGGFGIEAINTGIRSQGTIISNDSVQVIQPTPYISLKTNPEGSGSAYSLINIGVDAGSDPGNVFSGIYMYPSSGSANEMDFAISSYSPQYYGTPVGMIIAGGNNIDGNNTAIAFPADGTMQVFKDTNFNYNTSVAGYSKSTYGYTQVKMSSGQTVSAGSDVVVNFDNVVINNNGWFNNTGHTFQPPVAGTYEISFVVQVGVGTGNGQMNVQVRKNGSTQVLIVQDEVNKNVNHSFAGSVLVEFNGSTDYVDITFYTSSNSGSQVVQDNNGSFFKAILL